ncbi:arginine--tRNA ligase [Candidatus Kaiserbacteria bacterium]|nr:arginine--tRNA ligase [Candidatus Kaiserbacteria bacterium]
MDDVLRTAITDTLKDLELDEVDFSVEHPAEVSHGDYSSNVAMVLAKHVGEAPREVAEQIVEKLDGAIEHVDRIEIAGPGFINFFLTRDFFVQELGHVSEKEWGRTDDLKDEVIMFEYTSPNLFKPLHIGNLVGNIIGESVTRLLENAGADVKRINYPSDIGLTVAKGVWGLKKTGGNPDTIADLGEAYKKGNEAYENDSTAKEEIEAVNRALYAEDDERLNELRERGITTSRTHLKELLRTLGTSFDLVVFESEASPVGKKTVEDHVADGIFEESDGAIVFKGERHGLHTRVFLNSQGLPTYEAKDVGNFILKQRAYPEWTQSIVVTGQEQREYFKVIIAAVRELFPEAEDKALEHIPTGFLTLTTGKMSSRKGNVLTGESLIAEVRKEAEKRAKESRAEDVEVLSEQIAVAALKYQILRQKIGSDIVFDKERALSFEGDSGPYLQYTHARIGSVLEKAKEVGVEASLQHAPETPYALEHILYQYPEVVREATGEKEPHRIVGYLTELAGAFNTFYAQEKIADASDEYASYKVALAEAVKVTLKNGLHLLGIEAPERM